MAPRRVAVLDNGAAAIKYGWAAEDAAPRYAPTASKPAQHHSDAADTNQPADRNRRTHTPGGHPPPADRRPTV